MSGKATPQPFSDNFSSGQSSPSKFQKTASSKEFLFPIDEAPDFHDPYSDLNLFLSQKIKQEMAHHGSAKKWSLKIQEDLIKNITPDFQKNFPHYRLGISALKKTWEKITSYVHQIQHEKEAIAQDGKLNVHFFIKENLKSSPYPRSSLHLPAYTHAHRLAVKISECIATIDGIRPKLDHLVKLIWSVQRHLLSGPPAPSPYDEYDKIDKLIVKIILEITAKQPHLTQLELEHKVKETLLGLQDLPSISAAEAMASKMLTEKDACGIHHRVVEEVAGAMIDNPGQNLATIVQIALQFFTRTKELSLEEHGAEIERKIHNWTMQGDMLCRSIRLDAEAPLLKFMNKKWKEGSLPSSHADFVNSVCLDYLKKHPHLESYSAQLSTRVWILYKYCWYTLFSTPEESSLDRFVKWHRSENVDLEELCKKTLPLISPEQINRVVA